MTNSRPNSSSHLSIHQEQKTNIEALILLLTTKIKGLSQDLPDLENWTVPESENPVQRAIKSKEKVLKVSHIITSAVGPITTSKTASLHIENYHADLSMIKINQCRERNLPTDLRGMFVITLVHKSGVSDYYFIKQDAELVKAINDLRELASAMDIAEYSLAKGMIKACEKMTKPVEFWGNFNWDEKNTHGLYYDTINDPLIIDQFTLQVLPLKEGSKLEEPLVVLDMGAGKGRLADKLISVALDNNVPIHYIFVEPTTSQINIAREKLKKYKGDEKCKIEFIKSTLENLDLKIKSHCIISSGGAINMDVVPRDAAIANIKKLSNLLLTNGFLIATGQTAILIKAKHFKSVDLNVLSYAVPCVIPEEHKANTFLEDARTRGGFFNNFQRYVCKKTDDAEVVDSPLNKFMPH